MLKDKVTVVIPCKNESKGLYTCIDYLSKQTNIEGTKVIIADVSYETLSINWLHKAKKDFKQLDIKIIKGGYPSKARLEGSKLVETPYILFLDADIFLTKSDIIEKCLQVKKSLVTVPFYTDKPYRWVFRTFDIFQNLSTIMGTPFAVGGFQLWNRKTYWEIGGYKEDELFAEDYSISHLINKKDFKILKIKGTYTSARRFEKKGILWMFRIMIISYFNRNNPEFFKHHHNYWF